jgi:hypothetical protein
MGFVLAGVPNVREQLQVNFPGELENLIVVSLIAELGNSHTARLETWRRTGTVNRERGRL